MRLSELIAAAEAELVSGSTDVEITSLAYDSRRVQPGALFFALPGQAADGARFAAAAVERGAVAVLAESPLDIEGATVLHARPARRALGICAATFFGQPATRMKLLGVTGTNGKTTTTYLVEAMATAASRNVGVMGTIAYRFANQHIPAPHTTPEAPDLQATLAAMADAGVELAALEISSHALAQDRVTGCTFAGAAFTNLTRDHLDFHGTEEAYFAAKARLFWELTDAAAPLTINVDDHFGRRLADELTSGGRRVWRATRHGENRPWDLCAEATELSLGGTRGALHTPFGSAPFSLALIGAYNVENLLSATGLGLAAGLPLAAVLRGAATLRGVPGRLERVPDATGRAVFVDYAHSDDALKKALGTLRDLGARRIVCVFGCGGDRDRGKRPLMGNAAATAADVTIVTSDNPRHEKPGAIIEAILPGVQTAGRALLSPGSARAQDGYMVEPDRRAAIRLAIAAAARGDAVLIAGKGHEDYQIIGDEKLHFDDREEAAAALREVHP